jgi:hypothetical protein
MASSLGLASSVGLVNSNVSASTAATTVVNPMTTTDRGLIQRQREVMKMQDEMIFDIEKGVDKLHSTVS